MAARERKIEGVDRLILDGHTDARGGLMEITRNPWMSDVSPTQWNLIRSESNVLRGFHCHRIHVDFLVMIEGSMRLGLLDLRDDSPTVGRCEIIEVRDPSEMIVVPPGVGHGFYFSSCATLLQAASHVWDPDDDLGCRWDDPALRFPWGCRDPLVSERDRNAGTLSELRKRVRDVPLTPGPD